MKLPPLAAAARKRWIGLAALALLLSGALFVWRRGERYWLRYLLESPQSGRCEKRLDRALLTRSLELGEKYLLAHQKPEGNFDYEYDWRTRELTAGDQETRQAGALWGLSLLYAARQRPELAAAIERGLAFFDRNSRLVKAGRCVVYPGSGAGGTGTVALVALAHIEYLRKNSELAGEERQARMDKLDQYLRWLVQSRNQDGLWHAEFDPKTCQARGDASPYYDGEALLALVKAAKYLGKRELVAEIRAAAAAGKRVNIDEALARDADSETTKGYYQWSSMAYHELVTSDFGDTQIYGDTLLRLADWIIDTHHILTRSRNTGYAFEGIVSAYAYAKARGDTARSAKYACVIDLGLERLLGWQVGSPRPNRFTGDVDATDTQAIGGVQNEPFDSHLRIDVTQHQLHAFELARELVY